MPPRSRQASDSPRSPATQPLSPPPGIQADVIFPTNTETGQLCRQIDWAATPLGAVATWPASLRSIAATVLRQGMPQSLCVGPDLRQIYNDAYRVIMGDKHPAGLGKPVLENWREVSADIAPMLERVLAGDTVYYKDLPLRVHRNGTDQNVWFTFSYSPVPDESGEIMGLLVNCFETTDQVTGRQAHAERDQLLGALQIEQARLHATFQQSPSFLAILRGPDNVFESVNAAYEQIVGHGRNVIGKPLFEAMPETRGQGFDGYIGQVRETGEPLVFRDLPVMLERTPGTPLEQRFVDITYLPLIEADGTHPAVIAHGTDVTEQVRARRAVEEMLAASEQAHAEGEASRIELADANARLQDQALELELTNQQLQDNAVELEQQAEELQATASQLEERTEEAEAARRAAESAQSRVVELFRQAPAFIALLRGPTHIFEFANDAYYQLVGHRDIIGHSVAELMPEVRDQGYIALLDRVFATGEPYVGEVEAVELVKTSGANPQQHFVTFVVAPFRDAEGAISGVFVHGVDVTERVRAEQAVADSELQFRTLADAIPTLAWTARADGHLDWYNARWYEYTGTTPSEMEGWGWQSVQDPTLLPEILAEWQSSIATGNPFEMTFPLRGADGRFRQFLTRATPLRDVGGRVTRWFGSNTDVEVERATRAAVERAAARTEQLQLLTAELAAAVTLEDVAGVIVSAGERALGAATSALLLVQPETQEVSIIRSAGLGEAMAQRYSRFPLATPIPATECIRRGEPVCVTSRADLETRYPAARDFWTLHGTQAIASVPLIVAGAVIGAISFTYSTARQFPPEDVGFFVVIARQAAQSLERARLFAAERAARAAAEEANRAKTQFLSTMSHELRTPLNAIGGYAEILALGVRGAVNEAQVADLERIRRAGQHLQSLINDVLNFARVEAGRIQFDLRPVSVEQLLESVEELVMPQIQTRELQYIRQAGATGKQPIAAWGDPEKVRQILVNVLSNAIRFTPASQGRITTRYEVIDRGGIAKSDGEDVTSAWVAIHVTDTGRGIPADQLERIFEPFVQVQRDLSESSQQGVGLGLAISRDLARAMGGELAATSTLGEGSTFTLTLPAAK